MHGDYFFLGKILSLRSTAKKHVIAYKAYKFAINLEISKNYGYGE